MHERPADLSDAELSQALHSRWDLTAEFLRYEPVGYGGFHWTATDPAGLRWFITARPLAAKDDFADLAATMSVAASLAAAGLDFVVAPRRTASGQGACRLRPGYAVTVQPFADGVPGHWGDPMTSADRDVVIAMLAALHSTQAEPSTRSRAGARKGPGALPVRVPDLPGRTVLETALRERGTPWRGGPYAEPARALVAEHAAGLRDAMAGYDDLAAEVAARGGAPVLTHGEPHPGNLIRVRGGRFLLIDWDTAGLAQPERDLWWVLSDSGAEASRYADLTGRVVDPAAVTLYRLRWVFDDTTSFLARFRTEHRRDRDTEVAWAGFAEAVERLAAPEKI